MESEKNEPIAIPLHEVALIIETPKPIEKEPSAEEKHERRLIVKGTKSQLIALGDYMTLNGIYFEKIEGAK